MNALKRLWSRIWGARPDEEAARREFIYLDETSVYSLYASRVAPIKAEFTDTLTRARQSEVGGSMNPAAGAMGGGVTARAMSSQSRQSQVVSRAIVQTTFKELLEKERSDLTLQHVSGSGEPTGVENLQSLWDEDGGQSRLEDLKNKGLVLQPGALARGELLEIEVELQPEIAFQFSSVMQALAGMARKSPDLFGTNEGEIEELNGISGIIEELLVGLIPLRGRAVDYWVVTFNTPGSTKLIVHNRLLESLEDDTGFKRHPLFVVGDAEESSFWRDIRRVLFAKQRYMVLCRVARDDLRKFWVPLKLQEVVSSLFPELGDEIDKVSRGDLFKTGGAGLDEAGNDAHERLTVEDGLRAHASWIAESNNTRLSEDDEAALVSIAEARVNDFENMEDKRETFRQVEKYMGDTHGVEIDPDEAQRSRERALSEDGGHGATAPNPESDTVLPVNAEGTDDGYFLDCEFVAIYW